MQFYTICCIFYQYTIKQLRGAKLSEDTVHCSHATYDYLRNDRSQEVKTIVRLRNNQMNRHQKASQESKTEQAARHDAHDPPFTIHTRCSPVS